MGYTVNADTGKLDFNNTPSTTSDLNGLSDRVEAIREDAPVFAAGTATINVAADAPFGSKLITFPPGRFAVPPLVTATLSSAPDGSQKLSPRTYSQTKDGCTIGLYTGDFNTGIPKAVTVTVSWIAVQMSVESAAG